MLTELFLGAAWFIVGGFCWLAGTAVVLVLVDWADRNAARAERARAARALEAHRQAARPRPPTPAALSTHMKDLSR